MTEPRDEAIVAFLDATLGVLTAEKLLQAMEEHGYQVVRQAKDEADVRKYAVAVVRREIEAIATMTPAEKTIATPQNQAVWIVRELGDEGLLAAAQPTDAGEGDG